MCLCICSASGAHEYANHTYRRPLGVAAAKDAAVVVKARLAKMDDSANFTSSANVRPFQRLIVTR